VPLLFLADFTFSSYEKNRVPIPISYWVNSEAVRKILHISCLEPRTFSASGEHSNHSATAPSPMCNIHPIMVSSSQDKQSVHLRDVGHVIQMLMGDFFTPLYTNDDRYKNQNSDEILGLSNLRDKSAKVRRKLQRKVSIKKH